MKFRTRNFKAIALATTMLFAQGAQLYATAANDNNEQATIAQAVKINPTTVELNLSNKERVTIDFYGENIFRLFRDNSGGILRDPVATPEAKILVSNPRREVKNVTVKECEKGYAISTERIEIAICKKSGLMKVKDLTTGKIAFEETAPVVFKNSKTTLTLKSNPEEYYYGGGVQNGRFSHKGNTIAIENQNSWTDGGVASPAPFFWSTGGYGFMWHTFKKGAYDFGATKEGTVTLMHESSYLDVFFMVNPCGIALLNDFYQLTGEPVFIPKFGFYEGHLNAYNRDYWKENPNGFVYEDGKRYSESQTDTGGIKESLNGEFGKEQYQFSARAVVDRYEAHDMPLGWILPNDGYGAGYGQTETVCLICNQAGFEACPGAMGKASPLWDIELHDDDGNVVPDGEDGRIAVRIKPERPLGLFNGYMFGKKDNEECFVGDFYYTGDKARRDENGNYWYLGRSDDIIKSSGYRIGPLEVEEAIMQHKAVHEVAVVGAPDPMRGAKVKAYIVLHEGWEATESLVKELQQHCKRITAPYKYPREIEFVHSLPKTFSGKIKRDILRKYAETGEGFWE